MKYMLKILISLDFKQRRLVAFEPLDLKTLWFVKKFNITGSETEVLLPYTSYTLFNPLK